MRANSDQNIKWTWCSATRRTIVSQPENVPQDHGTSAGNDQILQPGRKFKIQNPHQNQHHCHGQLALVARRDWQEIRQWLRTQIRKVEKSQPTIGMVVYVFGQRAKPDTLSRALNLAQIDTLSPLTRHSRRLQTVQCAK